MDEPVPETESASKATTSRRRSKLERARRQFRLLRRVLQKQLRRTPGRLAAAYECLKHWACQATPSLRRLYSRAWFLLDRTRQRLSRRKRWVILAIVVATLLLLLVASVLIAPILDSALAPHITTSGLSDLLLAVGAALIGAAALAFTLVMFAMQVNVERLPHGLFRKISTDKRLLLYFAAMFIIALVVALCSLIASTISAGITILLVLWACLSITGLLWFAYRRALLLISPSAQLQLMVASTARHLQRSVRRAKMLRPLLKPETDRDDDTQSHFGPKPDYDAARGTIFRLDPNWAAEAHRSVSYAMSFAARYAEIGDYETSGAALTAIIQVNAHYIEAKGKTFVGSSPSASLTGLPAGGDSLISETLEHLRQYMQVTLGRKDERQIEQVFGALAGLTRTYLSIEYAAAGESKHYAVLGAGYLKSAVKTVPSLKSPDVLMDGVRQIGRVGRLLVANGLKSHVATMSEDLHSLAVSSLLDPQMRLVVGNIMEEYAQTLICLLISDEYQIRFEAKQLQEHVVSVTTLLLQIPETTFSGEHSSYAAPFYSTSNMSSLCAKLTDLTNAILKGEADDARILRVVEHLQEWAEDLWIPHRELLPRAVEKGSQLTFDLIRWISHVSQLLIVVASAPVSNSRISAELRRSASWLASSLSLIQQDKASIELAERFGLTEQLFDVARTAQERRAPEVAEKIQEIMLDRSCSAAAEEAGRQLLSNTIRGLCFLAVSSGDASATTRLTARLEQKLSKSNAPSREHRERTAEWLFEADYGISRIGHAMAQVDQSFLREALTACAAVLRGTDAAPTSG